MECPSCGKTIPTESVFCLYCGEKIIPLDPQAKGWEYKEIFLPRDAFAIQEKLVLRKRVEPIQADLEQLWSVYYPKIPGLLESEAKHGWSIDPDCLQPERIQYEIRDQTFHDYTRADWIWAAFITVFSLGIYLFYIRLVNASNKVVEPTGVNIRLRRKINPGA